MPLASIKLNALLIHADPKVREWAGFFSARGHNVESSAGWSQISAASAENANLLFVEASKLGGLPDTLGALVVQVGGAFDSDGVADDFIPWPCAAEALELKLQTLERASRKLTLAPRSALLKAPVAVVHTTLDGRVSFANEAAAAMMGAEKASDLVGTAVRSMYADPNGRELFMDRLRKHGRVEGIELEGFDLKNQHRVALLTARLTAQGVESVFTDITGLKHTENELRLSQKLNESIIETIPGGVVTVMNDGAIVKANSAAMRFLGLSFDSPTQRYISDYGGQTYYEDGRECPVDEYPVARALSTGEAQGPVTIGVKRPDGAIHWAVFSAIPTRDPASDAVSGAVVTFIDITSRREQEDQLRKLQAQIERTQKLESLGLLAGGIAHDFNNLLAAILGNAALARRKLPSGSLAEHSLEQLEAAARRAADLTNQMLAYSGRGRFIVEPINLSSLVRELSDLLGSVLSKRATLRLELDEQLPLIEADVAQLQQVVMNLLTNASDALEDNSGQIRVTTGVRRLDRQFLQTTYLDEGLADGEYIFLRVADSGSGMAEETRRKVFDPFFTTKTTGRGLGLAATLGIIRGHRGAVKLESAVGRGTTIEVFFPAAKPVRRRHVRSLTPPPGPVVRPAVVLLVDDEQIVRDVTRRMLEDSGFIVEEVASGMDALRVFSESGASARIELVLLDMTLPDMRGDEVLEALSEACPELPVVLCSGYTEAEISERLGARKHAGFLQKPYTYDRLVGTLNKALRRPMP